MSEQISLRAVLRDAEKLPWQHALYLPSGAGWTLDSVAIVWDPDDVDNPGDDESVPEPAARLGLRYVLSIHDLRGTVRNARAQLGDCSDEDLLRALVHYFERDAFIAF